jgi:hypothetical protein
MSSSVKVMVIYFVAEIINTSDYRRNDYLPQGI